MATSNPAPKSYTDSFSTCDAGFNSGIAPILLKKNQVANGANFSVRGGFLKTRPPIDKKKLVYSSPLLQTLVEKGFFQGGGYYRPDYGTESLLAQISGRLIKFTETGSRWTVTDVSIPGDLNAATTSQAWMWQSEKWMIIQDGTGTLPIFFDGTSSRRSYGASVLLGTTAALFTPPNPRVIGEVIQLTLTAPYTGPFNGPVLFNGEYYQPISSGSPTPSYSVILTNVSDTAGNTQAANSAVTVMPGTLVYGSITALYDGYLPLPCGSFQYGHIDLIISSLVTLPSGALLANVGPWSVKYWSDPCLGITHNYSGLMTFGPPALVGTYPNGTALYRFYGGGVGPTYYFSANPNTLIYTQSANPNVVVGNTVGGFAVPAIGSTVTVNLTQPYTGSANQPVWINGQQYLISQAPPPSATNILNLINLTDTNILAVNAPALIISIPEIQAGRMGAYGMSRNWYCGTDGITYFATDQVGDPSGTPANDYRDSVLKETENIFQANGGSFRLPGTGDIITAMFFPPIMDTALGQGQLQIFTAFSAFSNNSPVDRTTWAKLTSPLQTMSLKGYGALGQDSTHIVNSDIFFRSNAGIASLVQARRDFGNNSWGNKPISNELAYILSQDNKTLLSFGSGVDFDNRSLDLCSPNVSGQGVFHTGITSLNNELISSLRTTLPPAWEGLWTGINALKIMQGRVDGSIRCFAFTFNITRQKIELHELIDEADTKANGQYKDDGVTDIEWGFESPMLFSSDIKPLGQFVRLSNGEVSLTDIKGSVTVKVSYRPLNYPCWLDYHTFTVCADVSAASSQAQYLYRIGLGEPSSRDVDLINDMPFREGPAFQFMFEITGSCTFQGAKFEAVEVPMQKFAKVLDTVTTCQASVCTPKNWLRAFSTQGLPPQPLPPIPPPEWKFSNVEIVHPYCDSSPVQFTGTLPAWLSIDGGNLIVAADFFRGVTQIQADANAQAALNGFIVAQSANLSCVQSTAVVQGSCAPIPSGDTYLIIPNLLDQSIFVSLGTGTSIIVSSITVSGGGWSLNHLADQSNNPVSLPFVVDATHYVRLFIQSPPGHGVDGTLAITSTDAVTPNFACTLQTS